MFILDERRGTEAHMWRLCVMETQDTAEVPGF